MSWTSAEYLDAVGKEHDSERIRRMNLAIAAEITVVVKDLAGAVQAEAQEKNTENSELKQTIMDLRMQVNQLQRETQSNKTLRDECNARGKKIDSLHHELFEIRYEKLKEEERREHE